MAKYLGIPLTVSNGNRIPLTAQSNKVENPTFEGTQTPSGVNFVLSSGWRLNNSGAGAAASSSEFTSEGAKIEWPAATPPSSTYLRAWNVSSASNLIVFTKGKAYKMTYTISSSNNDSGLRLENGASIISLPTTVGTHEVDLVADIETFTIIRNNTVSSGATIVVSSVYVKEIAATETPTYGSPQLIPNSDFTTSGNWSFSDGTVSISNDELTFASSPNLTFASTSTTVLQKFKRYVVKIDITSLTGDNPRIRLVAGGDAATYSPYYSVTGVYTHTFTAIGNNTNGKIQVYFYSDTTGGATVNSVTLYEEPYLIGTSEILKDNNFNLNNGSWSFSPNTGWSISDGKATRSGYGTNSKIWQNIPVEAGKSYKFSYTRTYQSGDGQTNIFTALDGLPGNQSTFGILDSTAVGEEIVEGFFAVSFTGNLEFNIYGITDFTGSISNASVKEVEYNYLQVANGGFVKSVKEGDVIFNTSTNTEGVVKQVIDNNVLLMSNDNFSTPDEFFNVFAANGDTRGNQVVRTDKYIMSEYDEDPSNPQESSFWYAGGVDADKVTLTHLVPATNTFFVANVIEEYTQRLNAQSATASRLDIPLDAFRDHENNEVLTTTSITLS